MNQIFDCVVCGSCVVDILVRPFSLFTPTGGGRLFPVEPIEMTTGGITCNAGIAMARLGMKVAAFSYVGNDVWAPLIRQRLQAEGVDDGSLFTHPTGATSTTAVLIDPSGERSFAHCVGAPRLMDKRLFLEHLDLFARSRMLLLGYYSLMPNLESDLPEVFAAVREVGCRIALDAAGSGGTMQPLDRILPHLEHLRPQFCRGLCADRADRSAKDTRCFAQLQRTGAVGRQIGQQGGAVAARQPASTSTSPAPRRPDPWSILPARATASTPAC